MVYFILILRLLRSHCHHNRQALSIYCNESFALSDTPFNLYISHSSRRPGRITSAPQSANSKAWDWFWNIAPIGFSTICTVPLIVALLMFQERSLVNWHDAFIISPNTLVSILSGIGAGVDARDCHFVYQPAQMGPFHGLSASSRAHGDI